MELAAAKYQWSAGDARGYANAMGRYKTAKEWDFIRKHIVGDGLRILDIGGGSGRFAAPLARAGHHVTVIDKSRDALDLLESEGHPNISAVHEDFASAAFDEQFDAVVAIESLFYLTDMSFGELFTKVRSHLKPGAPFVFMQINNGSWRYRLHKLLRSNPFPYKVTSVAAYLAELRNAGFEVNDVTGFVWMPFGATSNSKAVPAFAFIERVLGLARWTRQSPWLLISAKRTAR